ncbi:MAG: hypothetical protein UX17_C0057G0003 [Parcubacteria group bacterium GW2011_GWC2_45_7]|nr:MAG: hypothetical protein UX17_C0057G0003 [Parcubacteria group bacterium GW2011_GWC2_45_7]KKU73271.1 MAG: hypothetical protein UX98_C0009G0002 [Parcubacteria group bacterium GW2011_GWA2_47_26]
MRIDISKFGESLLSRPVGREAALALQANVLRNLKEGEIVELDFGKVLVLTPSWGDEFISVLREKYGDRVRMLPSDNPSVQLTFKTIGEKVPA